MPQKSNQKKKKKKCHRNFYKYSNFVLSDVYYLMNLVRETKICYNCESKKNSVGNLIPSGVAIVLPPIGFYLQFNALLFFNFLRINSMHLYLGTV